jgi:anaerobic carbon-monoxide dehydrogenase iron sulfur subunit
MTKIYFDSSKCLGCHSCELACAVEHSKTKDVLMSHLEIPVPVQRRNVVGASGASLTISCRHCENAACMDACITAAMQRKDEYVESDESKCVGCWMCVMVCPFDAVRPGKLFSIKCDMCPGREDFACVVSCPTKALFAMEEDEFADYSSGKMANRGAAR